VSFFDICLTTIFHSWWIFNGCKPTVSNQNTHERNIQNCRQHHRREWRGLTIILAARNTHSAYFYVLTPRGGWNINELCSTSWSTSQSSYNYASAEISRALVPSEGGVCHFNSVRRTKLISLNAAFTVRRKLSDVKTTIAEKWRRHLAANTSFICYTSLKILPPRARLLRSKTRICTRAC